MLKFERLDALDIATSVETHAGLARLAADHGVHILCQKPLAPSMAEAERLLKDVGSRVRLMVHENWRFRPPYRQVAAWLAAGGVGEIRTCHFSTRSSGLISSDRKAPPALARQPFLATLPRLLIAELLIHHLDTARWLVGPLDVTAAQLTRTSEHVVGEDAATILLQGPREAIVVVDGNMSARGYPEEAQDSLEVVGTNGTILFDGAELRLEAADPQISQHDPKSAYNASYVGAIAHFVSCLRSGAAFETEGVDNLQTLKLVDAAYVSAAHTGGSIILEP
jgi:predicted dehydrogenase